MKELADTFISELEVNHPLQRSILGHFTFQDTAIYTELVPDGMSGNAFNYHHKQLIRLKLISKESVLYRLTPRGKLVIDTMSLTESRFKIRPVPCVFIYCTDKKGRVLQYSSKRQPLIGQPDIPYGKIRLGETIIQTLKRILNRRDIEIPNEIPPQIHINLRHFQKDELICHRCGPCFMLRINNTYSTSKDTANGYAYWTEKPDIDFTSNNSVQEITISS